MEQKRKVFLVKLPDGSVNLIPLEHIENCSIIAPNEKLGLWVHLKTFLGGFNGVDDFTRVKEIDNEAIEIVLKNDSICYVEVDYRNELKTPSNGLGYKKVILFLTNSEKDEHY